MGLYDTLFADDEAVACEAAGDFARLVPADQRLADGKDGVFLAGAPWVLASTTCNFFTQGLDAGIPLVLTKGSALTPSAQGTSSTFDLLITDTINTATGAATLRRKRFSSGVGAPPGDRSTGNTGVHFYAPTCLPQLTEATIWLRNKYRLEVGVVLQLPTDLRRACVLTVLVSLYGSQARQTDKDDFAKKAKAYRDELKDTLGTLDGEYGPSPMGRRPVVGVMPPTATTPQLSSDGNVYPGWDDTGSLTSPYGPFYDRTGRRIP